MVSPQENTEAGKARGPHRVKDAAEGTERVLKEGSPGQVDRLGGMQREGTVCWQPCPSHRGLKAGAQAQSSERRLAHSPIAQAPSEGYAPAKAKVEVGWGGGSECIPPTAQCWSFPVLDYCGWRWTSGRSAGPYQPGQGWELVLWRDTSPHLAPLSKDSPLWAS